MDTRKLPPATSRIRPRRMGVMGGSPCATCGVAVAWRIEQFCLGQRDRFGGRIYCLRCQAAFPRVS